MSRRRPLHTFGASILAILQNACTKAQGLNGPMGLLTRRTTTFIRSTFPFIYSMQYQWLAILSFADDQILTMENMVETIFPSSIHLFNAIDRLVYKAECLPGRFDDALNTFSKIIHQLPFLDWIAMHLISCLNFLISTLMHWGSKSTQEKNVMIDTICNDPRFGLQISIDKAEKTNQVGKSEDRAQCEEKEILLCHAYDSMKDEKKTAESSTADETKPDVIKCSYKEMLEKGTKENVETEEDNHNSSQYETPRSTISDGEVEIGKEKGQNENIIGIHLNDPILELYEASWHLK